MRPITNPTVAEISVKKDNLIDGKYIPYTEVSHQLRILEEQNTMTYKALRNKLYNHERLDKFNIVLYKGIKCFDTLAPMKRTNSSLIIKFEVIK